MRQLRTILMGVFFLALLCLHNEAANVTFQDRLYLLKNGSFITGAVPVTVSITSGRSTLYLEKFPNLAIKNGFFELVLGKNKILDPSVFNNPRVVLNMQLAQDVATFSITSIPYSIRAAVAETVLSMPASKITPNFTTTINMAAGFQAGTFFRVGSDQQVGIGVERPTEKLDVGGIVNSQGMNLNGVDIRDSFVWNPSPANAANLYLRPPNLFVGVGLVAPRSLLHVGGNMNAGEFLLKGQRLFATLDWKPDQNNLYFQSGLGRVGIGLVNPQEQLDIRGGIKLGTTSLLNVGTMRWNGSRFEGIVASDLKWISFSGIEGSGQSNQMSMWFGENSQTVSNSISALSFLSVDGVNNRFGIGKTPESPLDVKDIPNLSAGALLDIETTHNSHVLVVSSNGSIGIATTLFPYALNVSGDINASDYTINGEILRLSFSVKDLWVRRPSQKSLYYTPGNVGIGRPDPTNLLEISSVQKNGYPNPAISITGISRGATYTMGVDGGTQDVFRIVKGYSLLSSKPLFVAQSDHWGIGIDPPRVNLDVSGNSGFVAKGVFGVTPSVPIQGPGTRWEFLPSLAAFRAGNLEPSSPFLGKEWNVENVGLFSVAFGQNTISSGNISTILGGADNRAGGAYATILGGTRNRAYGDFSLSGGSNAFPVHHGSFVWSDSSSGVLKTNAEDQFLIRASGGVGMGTRRTSGAVLTVDNAFGPTQNTIQVVSSVKKGLWVDPSGNVAFGPKTGKSSHALSVLEGTVSLGVTRSVAQLTIQNTLSAHTELLAAYPDSQTATPGIILTNIGNLGIGIYPSFVTTSNITHRVQRGFIQLATGNVLAKEYVFPSGEKLSAGSSAQDWQFKRTTPNIYFVSGNVGIGTTKPRSLLSLSNATSKAAGDEHDPVITFDVGRVPVVTIGVQVSKGSFLVSPGGGFVASPPFVVSRNFVGVRTFNPLAPLHVEGASVFQSKVGISQNIGLQDLETSSMNASIFFLKGAIISAGGTPFSIFTAPDRLFYNSIVDPFASPPVRSNIGIGTTLPQAELEVNGTLNIQSGKAHSLLISNEFKFNRSLSLPYLGLDNLDGDKYDLFITKKRLVLSQFGTNDIQPISDVIAPGNGAGGNFAIWVVSPNVPAFTIISDASGLMSWRQPVGNAPGIWSESGNISVSRVRSYPTSLVRTNTILLNKDSLESVVDVSSSISHDGLLSHSENHIGESIFVNFDRWQPLAPSSRGSILKGLKIGLSQPSQYYFSRNGTAIGMNVDVSGVSVQDIGDKGYKYAAIFLSGITANVGIGVTPNAQLDVKGTVSANFFVISDRLTVTTINVAQSLSVLNSKGVGIGTTAPRVSLEVFGNIQPQVLRSTHGISARQINLNKANYVVDSTGLVGMGTTLPFAQWNLQKTFDGLVPLPFEFEILGVTLNQNHFSHNLTGLDLSISSITAKNFFGDFTGASVTATGWKIGMSNLVLNTATSSVTGLFVAVPTQNGGIYGARFMGGNVGIGVSNPSVALYVKGTITATNGPAILFKVPQEGASFNYMVITRNAQILGPVVAQDIRVKTLSQNSLSLLKPLNLSNSKLIVSTLLSNTVSVNKSLKSTFVQASGIVTASHLAVSRMGVGTSVPNAGLAVSSANSNRVVVSRNLTVSALRVNSNALTVISTGIGVGTSVPNNMLHMESTPFGSVYAASDSRTWNSLGVQSLTASAQGASGFFMSPDDLGSVGSGIAAIRVKSGSPTASHLVMMTFSGGTPYERVRVTSSGNVGIGTSVISSADKLSVLGTMLTEGTLSLVSGSKLDTLSGGKLGLLISSTLNVGVTFNVNTGNLIVTKAFRFKKTASPVLLAGYDGVYTDKGLNTLIYKTTVPNGDVVVGDVTPTVSATSFRGVPYYNASHRLNSSGSVWVTRNSGIVAGKMLVNTGNVLVKVALPTQNVTVPYTAQTVKLAFPRAGSGTGQIFSDVNVSFSGRLNAGDSATGMSVSINRSKIPDLGYTSQGVAVRGNRYAGIFLSGPQSSGNVMIATSPNGVISSLQPSANLHIVSSVLGHGGLWVEALSSLGLKNTALFVSSNSNIGVGFTGPKSKVTIKGGAGDSLLSVQDGNGLPVFSIREGRVGVGTSLPATSLEVVGKIKANQLVLRNGLTGKTMVVTSTNGGLSVTSEGLVGFGTTAPSAQGHFIRDLTVPNMVLPFVFEKIKLQLETGFSHNIVGIGIDHRSLHDDLNGTSSYLGELGLAKESKGFAIDLSGLKTVTGSTIVGLSSAVSPNGLLISSGVLPRNAGLFLGGAVGIGTSTPQSSLDIVGDLHAHNVSANISLTIDSATLTHLSVRNQSVVNQFLITTPNTLRVSVLSVLNPLSLGFVKRSNSIDRIPYLAATQNISANSITLNALILGKSYTLNALKSLVPTKALDVSGSVFIRGDVTINNGVLSRVYVSKISGFSSALVAPTVNIASSGVTLNGSLFSRYLKFTKAPTPNLISGNSALFVNAGSKADLIYVHKGGQSITVNISGNLSGTSNYLPYYDSTRYIASNSDAQWIPGAAGNTFAVGSNKPGIAAQTSVLRILSRVNTLNIQQVLGADHVRGYALTLDFLDRSIASSALLTGMGVTLNGVSFPGDRVAGLRVDVTSLNVTGITRLGVSTQGKKYAAVFMGGQDTVGSVGIAPFSRGKGFDPLAEVHVSSNVGKHWAFLVDNKLSGSTPRVLMVSSNSVAAVGVGTPPTNSRMVVRAGLSGGLSVFNDSGLSLLMVTKNGGVSRVGVGTTLPSALLTVQGTLTASRMNAGSLLKGQSLVVSTANGGFIVTSGGLVGIGTSQPSAQGHFMTLLITPNMTADYTMEKIKLLLSTSVNKNLTGFSINSKSDPIVSLGEDAVLGTSALGQEAKGVNIDLTGLLSASGNVVVGIQSTVSPGMTTIVSRTSNRNSALFMGGSVGIGTTAPQASLDLGLGNLRAANLTAALNLNVETATFNRINSVITTHNAVFNTLFIQNPDVIKSRKTSINSAITVKNLRPSLAQNTLVLVTATGNVRSAQITLNRLVVGRVLTAQSAKTLALPTRSMDVSGSAMIVGPVTINTGTLSRLFVNKIKPVVSDLVFSAPTFNFSSSVTVNGILQTPYVRFSQAATPNVVSGNGALYGNLVGQELYYIYKGSGVPVTVNLTNSISGTVESLPFYQSTPTHFSSSSVFFHSGNPSVLSIGTNSPLAVASHLSTLAVKSMVNTANTTVYEAYRVGLGFRDRSQASSSYFSGVSVTMNGKARSGDRAQGLRVDVTSLNVTSLSPLGQTVRGTKYAAYFLGGKDTVGSVGIGISTGSKQFNPKAELHVSSNITNQWGLLVDNRKTSTFTDRVLMVSANNKAYVGMGTPPTASRLIVKASASQSGALGILDVSRHVIFGITSNATASYLGIGTTALNASLTLTPYSSTNPVFRIDNTPSGIATQNSFVMDVQGNIGIGLTNPQVPVDIYQRGIPIVASAVPGLPDPVDPQFTMAYTFNGNSYYWGQKRGPVLHSTPPNIDSFHYLNSPFRVSTGSVSLLTVAPFGGVEIGTQVHPSTNFSMGLIVSRNTLAGNYSTGVLPSWISQKSTTANGLVAQNGSDFLFFGLRKPFAAAVKPSLNAFLVYGASNAPLTQFLIESGAPISRELWRFSGRKGIGIGATDIKASLTIQNDGTLPLMWIQNGTGPQMVIASSGSIGLGTTQPQAMVQVVGTIKAAGIALNPLGTLLETPFLTVSRNAVSTNNASGISKGSNVLVKPILTVDALSKAEAIRLTVAQDISNDVTGLSIKMSNPHPQVGIGLKTNTAKHLYGLKINTGGLNIDNPTWSPIGGKLSSAIFSGGEVVIGLVPTLPIKVVYDGSGNFYRYSSLLQVRSINASGNAIPTGSIAGFSSSGGTSSIHPTTLLVRSLGFVSANAGVFPRDFTALGISEESSKTAWRYLNNTAYFNSGYNYRPLLSNSVGSAIDAAFDFSSPLTLPDFYSVSSSDGPGLLRLAARDLLSQHARKFVMLFNAASISGSSRVSSNITFLTGSGFDNRAYKNIMPVAMLGFGDIVTRNLTSANINIIDKALVISNGTSGNMQLGIKNTTSTTEGFGNRMFFSGGNVMSGGSNSENTDSLWMGRYNKALNKAEIRVGVGELLPTDPSAKFVVGHSFVDETWVGTGAVLTVGPIGYVDPKTIPAALQAGVSPLKTMIGGVGIDTATPNAAFHVVGNGIPVGKNGTPATINHVMIVQNTSTSVQQNGLGIRIGSPISAASNYITFLVASSNASDQTGEGTKTSLGAIENDGSSGVQYSSTSADYAEYLLKQHSQEILLPGDIVGVYEGLISRETLGCHQVMVMSSAPVILGNLPPHSEVFRYGKVAFMGQVPVRVKGSVKAGDYIVASGAGDGMGVAVSEINITPQQIDYIVGRAWESTAVEGPKLVKTVVGFPFREQILASKVKGLTQLKNKRAQFREETVQLEKLMAEKLAKRQQKIDVLKGDSIEKK